MGLGETALVCDRFEGFEFAPEAYSVWSATQVHLASSRRLSDELYCDAFEITLSDDSAVSEVRGEEPAHPGTLGGMINAVNEKWCPTDPRVKSPDHLEWSIHTRSIAKSVRLVKWIGSSVSRVARMLYPVITALVSGILSRLANSSFNDGTNRATLTNFEMTEAESLLTTVR